MSSTPRDEYGADRRTVTTHDTRTDGTTVPRQQEGATSRDALDSDLDRDRQTRLAADHDAAKDRFGGMNLGAGFFGWLVAIGVTLILTSIAGAVAAALGYNGNITQSQAERQAGTIGLAAGIVLVAVLVIGYYAGGYVAGRMSRFDGGRQGLLVWLIGLVVTVVAAVLGWAAGDQYNLLDRVNLPNIPVSGSDATWGAVIAAAVIVFGTLLAAVLGGKIGRHYHSRVDKAAYRSI